MCLSKSYTTTRLFRNQIVEELVTKCFSHRSDLFCSETFNKDIFQNVEEEEEDEEQAKVITNANKQEEEKQPVCDCCGFTHEEGEEKCPHRTILQSDDESSLGDYV